MFIKLILAAACTCLAMASFNTNAALIDITATSTDTRFTDFTLKFDDISGDGLLQINEVVQFSGFTLTNPSNQAVNGLYDVIIGTPDIAGVSTSNGIPLFTSSNWNFKRFPGDTALCCSRDFWSYSTEVQAVTAGQTTVPIPAAAWLFGSGLIGLIVFARPKLG